MNALDQLGVPGLMVATTEFKPAAAAQSKSLGFEPEIIWVDHPIQNRTEDELKEIDRKIKDIVSDAAEFAQNSPEPDPSELYTDVLIAA